MMIADFSREIQINILKYSGLDAQLAMGIVPKNILMFTRFKGNQARDFGRLIKCLRSILCDATLRFTSEGIKLMEMGSAQVCLVNLTIPKASCFSYFCRENLDLPLNVNEFNRMVNSLSAKSELIMWRNENSDKLNVMIRQNNHSEIVHRLIPSDTDVKQVTLPGLPTFSYQIEIPFKDFEQIFRGRDDAVKLTAKSRQMIWAFEEPQSEYRFSHDQVSTSTVCSEFSSKYLLNFGKMRWIAKTVTVKLLANYPLVASCDIGNLGQMEFALAPQTFR